VHGRRKRRTRRGCRCRFYKKKFILSAMAYEKK
jgi:hypothetical protein